jgi:hypothetical protein
LSVVAEAAAGADEVRVLPVRKALRAPVAVVRGCHLLTCLPVCCLPLCQSLLGLAVLGVAVQLLLTLLVQTVRVVALLLSETFFLLLAGMVAQITLSLLLALVGVAICLEGLAALHFLASQTHLSHLQLLAVLAVEHRHPEVLTSARHQRVAPIPQDPHS